MQNYHTYTQNWNRERNFSKFSFPESYSVLTNSNKCSDWKCELKILCKIPGTEKKRIKSYRIHRVTCWNRCQPRQSKIKLTQPGRRSAYKMNSHLLSRIYNPFYGVSLTPD